MVQFLWSSKIECAIDTSLKLASLRDRFFFLKKLMVILVKQSYYAQHLPES